MTITLHRQRYLVQDDSVFAANLPGGTRYAAGYVDGLWPDYEAVRARFPGIPVLSIAVFPGDDAECLDIENGDGTPGQAPAWARRQKTPRPCLYASAGIMNLVYDNLTAAGFARESYRLWSAHYGEGEHICGPATCKLVKVACDGTQFTSSATGANDSRIDESLLLDDFFAGAPVPAGTEDDMQLDLSAGKKRPVSVPPGKTKLHFFDGEKREITIQWAGGHTETVTLDGMRALDVTVGAGLRDAIIHVSGLTGEVALSFD